MTLATAGSAYMSGDYWEGRQGTLYYQHVRILTAELAKRAHSMLDVGSGNCPYLDWYPHIPRRVSLDLRKPYAGDGIEPIAADFLKWQPTEKFDVVTCLQVLEHINRADMVARKLLRTGKIVVVSVPYKWDAGKSRGHIHDPVDEEKMFEWFAREPNHSVICREPISGVSRLIHVYESNEDRWAYTNERAALRSARSSARHDAEEMEH